MSDTLTYSYSNPSFIEKSGKGDKLFMSEYSEVQKGKSSCFFWGKLNQPFIVARCLIVLSNVVKSSFHMSPADLARLKDPIVTAGAGKVRFEGFSHCAGVYARVDVLPGAHEGEFPESGTTNVDFNQPMINALAGIRKSEEVILSVGEKELGLHQGGEKVIERKVPLPSKWIKGLTTVQIYLSETDMAHTFNRIQAIQLFKTLPRGSVKVDYYLTTRAGRPMFSPVRSKDAIVIGGIQRLRLLEPLIPLIDKLVIAPHKDMQSCTWQLYFGDVRFTFSISRDHWRGFSGEGAALDALLEDVPDEWLQTFENFSYTNQAFNSSLVALEHDINPDLVTNLTGRLAAMGLLGFDLDDNGFFFRRLPFKPGRIISLNPRLKSALKLLEDGKVKITSRSGTRVEAEVEGSGVLHMVLLEEQQERCTCTWYARHQGERGDCKHLMAVKKMIRNEE
ncbi:MAG: SWIM zinc finger domain-containing protein [Roseivirga sp.]